MVSKRQDVTKMASKLHNAVKNASKRYDAIKMDFKTSWHHKKKRPNVVRSKKWRLNVTTP